MYAISDSIPESQLIEFGFDRLISDMETADDETERDVLYHGFRSDIEYVFVKSSSFSKDIGNGVWVPDHDRNQCYCAAHSIEEYRQNNKKWIFPKVSIHSEAEFIEVFGQSEFDRLY